MDLNEELREKAEAGDADARYQLGINYLELSRNGQKDERARLFEEAIVHLKIASEQGAYNVCTTLAIAYWDRSRKGEGKEDFQNAILWFHKGAEAGESAAMEYLGDIYFLGTDGVQIDHGIAARWYEKAMQINPEDGSTGLGVCYDEGKGVAKNPLKAESCFKESSHASHYLGENFLGRLIEFNACGDLADHTDVRFSYLIEGVRTLGVLANATLHNFYDDHRRFDWRHAPGWSESPGAGFECCPGRMLYNRGLGYYYHGEYQQAIEQWRLSASHEFSRSEYSLGLAYMHGEGVEKDHVVGCEWLLKAAEQSLPQAQARIADAYLNGEGVEKNATQAVSWYKRASESGNVPAHLALARCYEAGVGVTIDPSLAFALYQRAAEWGNPQALSQVGFCYEHGRGVLKNLIEALAFARLASEFNLQARSGLSSLRGAFKEYLLDLCRPPCPGEPKQPNKHAEGLDEAYEALAADEDSCALSVRRLELMMSPTQISESGRRRIELSCLISEQRTT